MLLGMNLVLRRPLVTTHAVGARSGDRFLFLVPWRDRSIVGTAYDPPTVTPDVSVSRFVEEVRRAFPWAGIGHDDVSLVHRGLVPARPGGRALETRSRVVDHEVVDDIPGLVSMRGVKLTTARAEAEKAVDLVVRRLGRSAPPCRTATTPAARGPSTERLYRGSGARGGARRDGPAPHGPGAAAQRPRHGRPAGAGRTWRRRPRPWRPPWVGTRGRSAPSWNRWP